MVTIQLGLGRNAHTVKIPEAKLAPADRNRVPLWRDTRHQVRLLSSQLMAVRAVAHIFARVEVFV